MAITQPGDTTVISFVSVPGDAGPATRAESVQGGFVAITGSGPPDAARLPLVMRRAGELVYTPTDNKFWQLIAGTADANWVEKTFGKGGLVTVATNAARDALPSSVKSEGMLVYSQQTQCYYSLGADLATWTFFYANPALNTQANWWINASTGSETNDGLTSATALASTDELRRRLNPGGKTLQVAQNTVVNIAAGTYPELILSISIPVGSGYTFDVVNAYTSGSSITLSSVTNTVPSATPTRGNIQTASGAFADKARIRSTSGANAGAITYCTGLNGGATNAWVKQWFLESALSPVNVANGTTCVVDTLQVTINRLQVRCSGHPLGGQIRIFDAILPNGAELVNTIGGSASLFLSQCALGATGATCRIAGNVQLRNCRLINSTQFSFYGSIPLFLGCEVEAALSANGVLQVSTGCAFNGASIAVAFPSDQVPSGSGLYLAAAEWVNGSGTAVHVSVGASVQVDGQQFGFGSAYAVGFALSGGAQGVTAAASYLGILATQQITMAGVNANYADVPLNYPACSFVLLSDPTAKRLVSSASSADSAQTQLVFQPGGVAGNNVFTSWPALVTFAAGIADPKVVVFDDTFGTCVIPVGAWDLGRGCEFRGVLPASTINSASSLRVDITCADGVTFVQPLYAVRDARLLYSGTHVLMTVPGTGKRFTFYLFGNGVVATTGSAGVAFSVPTSASFGVQFRDQSFVTVAGGSFFWSVAAGATIGVITATGDGFNPPTSGARLPSNSLSGSAGPAYQFVQDFAGMISATQGSMPGGVITVGTEASPANIPYTPVDLTGWGTTPTTAQGGLDGLKALIAGGVLSVFGRVGAVVAVAGDYPASKINNDSATVTGTHVSDALDALKALIAASVTGVSSVYGRTGAVVAATNDYTDLQIQNTSSVAGTGVKGALNTLLASIGSLVTGVSSVYGRTGAVVAATNDYNSTQVTNSSGVTGTGVTGALNTLDTEITNLNRQYASVVTTGLSTATLGLTNEKGLFLVSGTAGSPTAFTVPNQSTVAWHIGSQIDFIALNADNFTISGAAGVTIRTPVGNLAATNSLYHLISIDINLWELTRVPVDSTHLTNTSGVSGATVTDALNTLNAKTSSDITNASTVVGTTITDALQTLQAETPGVVGVSVPIIPMLGTSGWSGGINDCYMGTGASGSIGVAIPLYPNLALSSVDVRIEPNTGHGSVPSGLPIVQAWVSKAGAHVGAGLAASVSDTGHATVADYELEHSMTIVFGTPLTPAGAQSCWLRIVDENALPGLRLRFVKATYS